MMNLNRYVVPAVGIGLAVVPAAVLIPYPFSWIASGLMAACLAAAVFPGRVRLEQRARAVLAQIPDAELTTVFLPFAGWHFLAAGAKQEAITAKVVEMSGERWIYVRATEASLARTLQLVGGGVNLQFARPRLLPGSTAQ
jgi:hypothetical protein